MNHDEPDPEPIPTGHRAPGMSEAAAVQPPPRGVSRVGEEQARLAEVRAARLRQLAGTVGLADDAVAEILDRQGAPESISRESLRPLVEAGTLSPDQAAGLSLAAAVYPLTGGDAALTAAVRAVRLPGRDAPATQLRDLVALDTEGWARVMSEAGVKPPNGYTVEDYAAVIRGRVDRIFPGDALAARLAAVPERLAADLRADTDPAARRRLAEVANSYPGLGIDTVLTDRSLGAAEKLDRIGARLHALDAVRAANADVDLLQLDLSPGSPDLDALRLDGADADTVPGVLRTLKAHQRVYQLAADVEDSQRLLRAGYGSAVEVARGSVDELVRATGLTVAKAERHHAKAEAVLTAVSSVFGGTLEIGSPYAGHVPVATAPPGAADYLRTLDGYADLFGSQSACDCGHCASILSPAAYFADLMLFVDRQVSRVYFAGARATSPLHLRTRRPDLWTTPLTCENTTTMVPSLDVINEILENYVATSRGYTGAFSDRVAVGKVVYEQALSVSEESPRLPFNLALERLRVFLGHDEVTRAQAVEVTGAPAAVRTAAVLDLSPREHALVTSANSDLTFLRGMYGLPLVPDPAGVVPPFDAQDLVRAVEVTREDLGALLGTRFVASSGATVRISAEKTSPQSVQNDIERVHGLTAVALDRLHRFLRLWRRLDWSVTELDLVLTQVAVTTLTADELVLVAALRSVRHRLDVPVAEVCALAGALPRGAAAPGEPSLFDQRFNPAPFAAQDGSYPKDSTSFLHPALRAAGAAPVTDVTQHRLQAGLGVTEAELLALIRGLSTPLGADPDAPTVADRAFTLTAEHLSALYRHTRLARLLDLSIVDLFRLLGHTPQAVPAPGDAGRPIAALGRLVAVLDTHEWWRAGGRTLDDLDVIARRAPADPSRYPQPAAVVTAVLAEIAAEQALSFADTVFAFLDGVTEATSRAVIAANPARFVAAGPRRFRLAADFDLTTPLAAPAGVVLDAAAVRELLAAHHPSRVLPTRLAGRLNLPAPTVVTLLGLLGADLSSGALPAALHGTTSPAPLVALLTDLVPLAVLVGPAAFTPAAVAALAAHPAAVGLTDPRHISDATVRALSAVTADSTATDVLAVLAAYTGAAGFAAADQAALAAIVAAPPGLLPGLLRGTSFTADPDAAAALRRLSRAAALATRLGIGGETLALLGSSTYADLDAAADALLAALRARFPGKRAVEQIEPLEDTLRERRRDALGDFLIHSSFPQFTTRADLYRFFLIDVELQGCARTSRVVAATASLQLYVYRCLMNLEQDQRAADDPAHLRVPPDAIPAGEWSWRKSYRVWEANRKVFLWPENYLEPQLRDDRTPLFAELEATLLQRPVDEQSVLDAYAAYLAGFEELARLQIAGSYHEKDPVGRTDVLHLFGVSPGEPATFSYRAVRNAHYGVTETDRGVAWGPWRKIDVQIGARQVSPIVVGGRLHLFWAEWVTKPQSSFVNGNSTFAAYRHTMALKYTTLRLDGTWTAPQRFDLTDVYPFVGDGVLTDTLRGNVPVLDPTNQKHLEPREGYRPRGFAFDRVYPFFTSRAELYLAGANFGLEAEADLRARTVRWDVPVRVTTPGARRLYASLGTGSRPLNYLTKATGVPTDYELASFYLDGQRMTTLRDMAFTDGIIIERDWGPTPILTLPAGAGVEVVNGSLEDCVIDAGGDLLLLQGSVRPAPGYLIRRLGTRLAAQLAETLFVGGVDKLLDTGHQLSLAEPPLPVSNLHQVAGDVAAGKVDFTGPYGVYYREIFQHIPFLIATHLSGQQRFAAAQRWYHYLFDPTASETIQVPAGLSAAEAAHRALDRNWRYREFRGLGVPSLRAILTDRVAIEAYQRDPFNPHAIARLRLTAYQKNVVMKYVDNLLDWADSLFAQFTTESVNEATLLYATAAAILGERPALLGGCGEGAVVPKTYARIAPLLEKGSQFLAELETTVIGGGGKLKYTRYPQAGTGDVAPLAIMALAGNGATVAPAGTTDVYGWKQTRIGRWEPAGGVPAPLRDHGLPATAVGHFGWSIATQVSPVFCVPRNPELGSRWQRVEDQLFKIRNCLDITGARRALALFAPEIDPRLLVRARAAGLSLDDVLGAIGGNLPPYRFSYLIDRAKSHAALVQSFGGALLSALEKKDLEELTRLRGVHQQNLLKLATRARQWEVDAAEDAIEVLHRQYTAAEYRRDHYQGLADQNLIPAEQRQSDSRNAASVLQEMGGTLDLVAGIAHLVPQLGAPTAMKFGGMEVGHSSASFSDVLRSAASVFEADAASAGLLASFERRKAGWLHQVELVKHELSQLDKQLEAARIRRDIAQRSLDLHQASIDHGEELLAFYGDRFTGLGLYTWLSTTMQRALREAYNGAYAMARLAEQAYRFERDDTAALLAPSYWDAGRAGLLAGERLLIDLQAMERRFVETNHRTLEVDQAVSLTLVDPAALLTLRETGTCDFGIDEFHFDLLYPGHYRRKVKSVRLTIPCVTGPYTNVSATLTLLGSALRRDPHDSTLTEVPLRRSVSIATSTAQQDAGVFEFSFRDERYMPFEGAGAASRWRLTLPRTVRPFDYRTITDVILHVTYTAEANELLRQHVEGPNTEAGSLLHRLKTVPATRVLSLRHDFSAAYQRLLSHPVGTAVPLRVGTEHFPQYLSRRTLTAATVTMAVALRPGAALGGLELSMDGTTRDQFPAVTALGGLPAADVTPAFATQLRDAHTIKVVNSGGLAVSQPIPGDLSALDPARLEDILIVVSYLAT